MTTYGEILDKAGIGNLKTIMTTYGKILDKAGIGNLHKNNYDYLW